MKRSIVCLTVVVAMLALAGQSLGQTTQVPIAHWSADGTTEDITGNGYDGRAVGDPGYAEGVVGQAFSLDGIDDCILIDKPLNFGAYSDYTIAGWFKTQESIYQQDILTATSVGTFEHGITIEVDGRVAYPQYKGRVTWTHRPIAGNSGGTWIPATPVIADGEWHHFAATRQGAEMTLYVDGVVDGSYAQYPNPGTDPANIGFDVQVALGRAGYLPDPNGTDNRYFAGLIDEVSIYSTALSADDVGDMVAPPPPAANEPPDVSGAGPSIGSLWPPNNKMVDITIEGVTDLDGDDLTITVDSITDDEGSDPRDVSGLGSDVAVVRAQRDGKGDGREYTITFSVSDGTDTVQASVVVLVPHDQGTKTRATKGKGRCRAKPVSGVQSTSWGAIKSLAQ
jgi:hypothetical protein